MPTVFSWQATLSARHPSNMSASPKKAESARRIVVLGSVAVRPANETRAELQRACDQDRKTLATPIPPPTSGTPTTFSIVRRPPLPAPPPRRTADVGPVASAAERRQMVAGMAVKIKNETEAVIEPLRRNATAAPPASRPAAPRGEDDPYDLAKWRRWSLQWNE